LAHWLNKVNGIHFDSTEEWQTPKAELVGMLILLCLSHKGESL
jgi:hypothetical protein